MKLQNPLCVPGIPWAWQYGIKISGLRPEPCFFFAPKRPYTYKWIAWEFFKVQTPPSSLGASSPWTSRYQWGIGFLRSTLKFEAPQPLMLLLMSPGHGNMVSKSRGCAPNPAFSSPPRAPHPDLNAQPESGKQCKPPLPLHLSAAALQAARS